MMFLISVGTYLVSKEIFVFDHEAYGGVSLIVMWTAIAKKLGPAVGASIDKGIDHYEFEWNWSRIMEKKVLENGIKSEKHNQQLVELNLEIVRARREGVLLQLEGEYRRRLNEVFNSMMLRLKYQAKIGEMHRRYIHNNMLDWMEKAIMSTFTPEWNKSYMASCMDTISKLQP